VKGLASLGAAAASILALLEKLLLDPDRRVRDAAQEAVGNLRRLA
jgi:hypothetical protein